MAFNRPSRPELYNEERKMQIYNFITDYINEYGVSPSIPEMADEFHVSKATIHKYLVRLQDQGYIERFGKNQMTTKETLFNVANIPIVGSIACGKPTFALEDVQGYLPINKQMLGGGDFFALIAEGNSMVNVGVSNGDLVVVRKQDFADEGQIVVALVPDENGSGETATLKRYYVDHARNNVRLHPENDEMTDFYVDNIKILGVAKSVVKQLN